jgi:hypothetical protein
VSARRLPGDVQLRRTDDAGGWHVLRTRSDVEAQVVIGSVRKAAGGFCAAGPDGHRIVGPLDGGRWSTRSAAVAAIRETDIAVMHR